MKRDIFKVANKKLKSRLIIGTGKYKNFRETAQAVKESGADMVTVAVRRVNILDKKTPILTDNLNPKKIIYLPNTAGCYTIKEAILTAELARESLKTNFVKLEVIGNDEDLLPDVENLIPAAKELVKIGTQLNVKIREKIHEACVVKKPFYRRVS